MASAATEIWEERLRYTTKDWTDRGLTGARSEKDLARAMRFYRGEQDNPYHGDGDNEKAVTANLVFRSANTLDAQVAARAPRVLLFPRAPEAQQSRGAAQALYNYFVRELRMKDECNQALRDSWYAPFGFVRHGYTPAEEFRNTRTSSSTPKAIGHPTTQKPDVPWIQRVPIWDVRIDLTAGNLRPSHARWMATRSFVPKEDLDRNPNTRGKNIVATSSIDRETDIDLRTDAVRASKDFLKMCEVWTIWDRIERQWMQWSPGHASGWVREPADWPIPWDELPYSIVASNWQMDDQFPVPLMSQIVPLQEEMNNIRTMMSVLTRSLRRLVFLNDSQMNPQDAQKILDGFGPNLIEFFRTKGIDPGSVVSQIQAGGFPQELFVYANAIEEDVRELIGQSRMDRGQRINVESATEANDVQQGSNTHKSRHQIDYEEFWSDVIRKFGQGLRTVMDEEQVIPILGAEDAQTLIQSQGANGQPAEPFLTVSAEDVGHDYMFQIQVGSTMPRTKGEERAKSAAWLDIQQKFPQIVNPLDALTEAAIAWDKDPAKALLSQEEIQQANAVLQDGQIAPTQDGGGGAGGLSPLAIAGAGGN